MAVRAILRGVVVLRDLAGASRVVRPMAMAKGRNRRMGSPGTRAVGALRQRCSSHRGQGASSAAGRVVVPGAAPVVRE